MPDSVYERLCSQFIMRPGSSLYSWIMENGTQTERAATERMLANNQRIGMPESNRTFFSEATYPAPTPQELANLYNPGRVWATTEAVDPSSQCAMTPPTPENIRFVAAGDHWDDYASRDDPFADPSIIPDNDPRCWLVIGDMPDRQSARRLFKDCPEIKVIRRVRDRAEIWRKNVFKKKKRFTLEHPSEPLVPQRLLDSIRVFLEEHRIEFLAVEHYLQVLFVCMRTGSEAACLQELRRHGWEHWNTSTLVTRFREAWSRNESNSLTGEPNWDRFLDDYFSDVVAALETPTPQSPPPVRTTQGVYEQLRAAAPLEGSDLLNFDECFNSMYAIARDRALARERDARADDPGF